MLIKGTFVLVDIEEGSPAKLLLALVFLLPTIVVTPKCGVLTVEIRGSVIGEDAEYKEVSTESYKPIPMPSAGAAELILGKVMKEVYGQTGAVQSIKKCHLPASVCEGKTYNFEVNFGSGFEEAGEEQTDELETEAGTKMHIDY